MKTEQKKKYYLDAEELKNEIIKSKQQGQFTNRLGELLMLLHDNILKLPRFCRKDHQTKEEIKSYSLFRFIKKGLKTFDENATPKKTFNYMTSAIVLNMTRRLQDLDRDARKHAELLEKTLQNNDKQSKKVDMYT